MHVGSGDAKKVWHLPAELLKSKSTFFTAALEGGFAEGISQIITLPEENPRIFQVFVAWLYVGNNQIVTNTPDFFVSMWALGDRLGCPLIQDDAMCGLVALHRHCHLDEVTLKQIYELSAPESKIRRFAVDKCLFDIRQDNPEWHENKCSYFRFAEDNEDFAQQLAVATILLGSGNPKDPRNDKSPYLFTPSTCTSEEKSGS